MTKDALIGYTGFVGSTLLRQGEFTGLYRSTNIEQILGCRFDTVVCAGAPGVKWKANRNSAEDAAAIDRLITCLAQVRCERMVLISTVDVFCRPVEVDEDSEVAEDGLAAYGLHRRRLEKFVASRFDSALIVRLPGLVGPGLRKNVIYDLKHDNHLDAIDTRGMFQFYPVQNLWSDIGIAQQAGLKLLHLTAEPVSAGDVAEQGFAMSLRNELPAPPARYDFRTRHAAVFGAAGFYQYTRQDTIAAVRAYARASE